MNKVKHVLVRVVHMLQDINTLMQGLSEDEKSRGVFIIVTFVVSLVSFARRPINRHVARTERKNGS